MERQKDREGHGKGEKQKVIKLRKNRERHGEVKRQRKTWRGKKTEKYMER